MATWSTPLPDNGTTPIVVGAPGHDVMHNEIVDNVTEIRDVIDALPAAPASDAAAGVASLRTLNTTATSAAAGNHTHTGLTAQPIGTPSVRALVGGTLLTASASDHTHTGLLTGAATAVTAAAVPFADLSAAATAYNTLLTALRTRGVIS